MSCIPRLGCVRDFIADDLNAQQSLDAFSTVHGASA